MTSETTEHDFSREELIDDPIPEGAVVCRWCRGTRRFGLRDCPDCDGTGYLLPEEPFTSDQPETQTP